ncbi:MAG: glycosyltransferase [Candidatus Omnitrophica bacterium]|nr:glycosyltransferase [Candidatus Omnitrophota bacterium]
MNPLFNDEFHAKIDPVTDRGRRPRWTVLIPTYNCANYLKEALASVLDQDPGPENMEIIVVDDCSKEDDPEAVVKGIGRGRVAFVRQKTNVGKVRNYETGLKLSKGILIHQLHGDDKVEPGFYKKMEELFDRYPYIGAAFCQSNYIDKSGKIIGRTGVEREDDGVLADWFSKIAAGQRIQTPSMVVKREVYEELGGFDRRLDCLEDWEMWVRIAARYPVAYTRALLADYRCSITSATQETLKDGTAFRTLRELIVLMDGLYSGNMTKEITKNRNVAQAEYWLNFIPQLMKERNSSLVLRVFLEALRYSFSFRVFKRALGKVLRKNGR